MSKHLFVVQIFLSIFLFSCVPSKKEQVNILFIMSDQHRGDFLGVNENNWIKTPNLDKIAKEGVNFFKAYTSLPSCTPARTSIYTGLSPWNHGMLGYMNETSQSYECEMPSLFAQNGYITHAIGKNHFGTTVTHGYQVVEMAEPSFSITAKGKFKCDYQKWFEKVAPGKDLNATGLGYTDHRGKAFLYADSLHPTYWVAERAVNFIKNSKNIEKPWLLKVSFHRPHPPFDPPQRWLDYYQNVDIPLPKVGGWAKQKYQGTVGSVYETPNASYGIYPEDEIKMSLKAYSGAISFIDEQIGRIISVLKESGNYENTLIVYLSDHGDMMGDQNMWRKCRAYEPSSRIPMILRWPESLKLNIERGIVRDELIELRDVFPTFADAANIEIPVDIDGESMFKILKGQNDWRQILDLEHSKIYEDDNAWIALTNGRYKYIYFTLSGEEQLFDLNMDPFELNNIVYEPNNQELHNYWYQKMVEHLKIRGSEWVSDNKLQILQESVLKGKNFPDHQEKY